MRAIIRSSVVGACLLACTAAYIVWEACTAAYIVWEANSYADEIYRQSAAALRNAELLWDVP